ncbi:protein YAE1 homolog isoform X1 [Ambystoma mexicanum]|uniref:protein YAE1 homolog isoform X1 n=1 Tax=Ambystoma mexicanum TaxID=8296 RepID=UPI0037E78197
MPWVQAVQPDKGDDVFDEEADDLSLLQQEWKTTMEKRVKEGYRDGMDAGKADALQQGFNNGYKEGMALMMTCGTLKGSLWALKCWSQLRAYGSYLTNEIEKLLEAVGQYEENTSRILSTASHQPHPGELADSIQDISLNQNVKSLEHLDSKEGRFCESGARSDGECCKHNNGATFSDPGFCRKSQESKNSAQLNQLVQRTISVAKSMNMSDELVKVLENLVKQ